jgi:hypothetical protein
MAYDGYNGEDDGERDNDDSGNELCLVNLIEDVCLKARY